MQDKVVKVFALSLGPVKCFPQWPEAHSVLVGP